MTSESQRYVITVLTRDRVGIIADVTKVLFELGGNLEALSQTVVWGWFTMIICAKFPSTVSLEEIKFHVEKAGNFAATVLPFREKPTAPFITGQPFIVTAFGDDKPGIVYHLTSCLARKGINIEDVWNEVNNGQFTIIFHITVPEHVDPKDARYELEHVAREVGVNVSMQHQDIFTATNSLSLHTRLPQRQQKPKQTLNSSEASIYDSH